ncbi:D-alanyl-D-alanine carboxypeptidase/D-alanyl-D-alanine-endopeptidase [Bifidobacterium simiarum]|uniref:D-alanyl-D-alanine carboxypeptidase/D-alanyl-D-alanine endopeptidase n=1 Tax=Bifidobacterium simiarum TaxID=2045441 RepID=UPI0030B850A1
MNARNNARNTGTDNASSRRAARQWRRTMARRRRTVAIAVIVTILLGSAYVIGDAHDVLPGPLSVHTSQGPTFPAAAAVRQAKTVTGDSDTGPQIDAAKVKSLVDAFAKSEGVGNDFSVVIADGNGDPIVQRAETTPREPASTMKTMTAYAASTTLDMSSTLDTEVYLDESGEGVRLVLKGNGDMLLGEGASDPDHINGRAGLATLVDRTIAALNKHDVNAVTVAYDDSLFGSKRFPDTIGANNPNLIYAAPMASMAIDEARNWTGVTKPKDPDVESSYPTRSSTPASDVAKKFAAQLKAKGIKVSGSVSEGTAPDGDAPIASVSSAHLSEIMGFMLKNSDNTEAELFGRLTALKTGKDNSPEGATAAVKAILAERGIDLTGVNVADCSGLSQGSKLTVRALAQVQAKYVESDAEAAPAAEGLAISGLSGTALHRTISSSANGLVRLKTGSLDQVTSMTGNVSRAKGGTLIFSIIVNKPGNMWSASRAVDKLVSELPEV